jgi:hypothetical protein
MEINKPEYPLILVAKGKDKMHEYVVERRLINGDSERRAFEAKHIAKGHYIVEERPSRADIKHLPLADRLMASTPKWVYFIVTLAIGFLLGRLT